MFLAHGHVFARKGPDGANRTRTKRSIRSRSPNHVSACRDRIFARRVQTGPDRTGTKRSTRSRNPDHVSTCHGHNFAQRDRDRTDGMGPGGQPDLGDPTMVTRVHSRVFARRGTRQSRRNRTIFARRIRTESMYRDREVDQIEKPRPWFRPHATTFLPKGFRRSQQIGTVRSTEPRSPNKGFKHTAIFLPEGIRTKFDRTGP